MKIFAAVATIGCVLACVKYAIDFFRHVPPKDPIDAAYLIICFAGLVIFGWLGSIAARDAFKPPHHSPMPTPAPKQNKAQQ